MERPYRFENIPKLTQATLDLQNSVSQFISAKPFQADFLQSVSNVLDKYLKIPCEVSAPENRLVHTADLPVLMPQAACILVIGAAPGEEKILVEIDPALVGFALERLLGGSGEHGMMLTTLTEFEQGVVSFLLLKIIQTFQQGFKSGSETAFTLDKIVSKFADVKDIADKVETYHFFGSRIAYGSKVGYARIFLPDTLIRSFAPESPKQAGRGDLDLMRKAFAAIGEVSLEGRIIAATLALSKEDLESLQPGDVVILENHQLSLGESGLTGEVLLKIGSGKNGSLRGDLSNHDDHCRVQITEIAIQETPRENP